MAAMQKRAAREAARGLYRMAKMQEGPPGAVQDYQDAASSTVTQNRVREALMLCLNTASSSNLRVSAVFEHSGFRVPPVR
jgi:hypothetical protein